MATARVCDDEVLKQTLQPTRYFPVTGTVIPVAVDVNPPEAKSWTMLPTTVSVLAATVKATLL